MRVSIDRELCESNGVCSGLVPSVFELRDDDVLYVLQEQPPEALRAQVELAAVRCPRQAITVSD